MHMNSMNSFNAWINGINEFIYLCELMYGYEFYDMSMNSMNSLNTWIEVINDFI